MIKPEYLAKGLTALSRAHLLGAMAGHLGAALVAGYLIGEQHPDLDHRVYAGIEGELDRIIQGESVFGPKEDAALTVADLFRPFENEQPHPENIDAIAEALSENIDQTRESGHNVIFAALAIRALKVHPDFAAPSVIGGCRQLIAGFNHASPGSGYYGKEQGRINGRNISLPQDDTFPLYANLREMANVVMDELIEHAEERRNGFGGLVHLINHGAALIELAANGYPELACRGLAAHHQHLCLLRTLPNVADELGEETPSAHDPWTPAYWSTPLRRDRARLEHRIKTLYGFEVMKGLIADMDKRNQADERLHFLI